MSKSDSGRVAFKDAVKAFPLSRWLMTVAGLDDTGGRFLYVDCPVCGGKRKLLIRRDTKTCTCFRCADAGTGREIWPGYGSLVRLIELFEHIPTQAAIRKIYDMAGIPERIAVQNREVGVVDWPPEVRKCTAAGWNHPCRAELRRRGMQHLEETVGVCVTGLYADRWILPVYESGQLVGWEAKSYGGGQPKSLFPTWFHKSEYLYRTQLWGGKLPYVVVTESIFDAETLGTNALGLFGSSLSQTQLSKLIAMTGEGIRQVYWMLDPEAIAKTRNIILGKCLSRFDNYLCVLPPDEDPNSIGRLRCWEHVANAIQVFSEMDFGFLKYASGYGLVPHTTVQ